MKLRVIFALSRLIAAASLAVSIPAAAGADRTAAPPPAAPVAAHSPAKLDNAGCLGCHDGKQKLAASSAEGATRTLAGIAPDKYDAGVHAKMQCVDCHTDIVDNVAPHARTAPLALDCAGCHEALWEAARKNGSASPDSRLAKLARNAAAYAKSFHAQKQKDDPARVNARCDQCHDTHSFAVPTDRKSDAYDQWRLGIPDLCGSCHEKALDAYEGSVHGVEVREGENAEAAVCTDCHTTHEIGETSLSRFKLLLPEECGNCHRKNLKTYRDTYHGQVGHLGGDYTAKCYDCHGAHDLLRVDDENSKVHPDKRLETCKSCHDGKKAGAAAAGFASFAPHAHAGDFKRYPQVWIAARFMIALLAGVFAFFWLHSGLWYYREWMDRRRGVRQTHVLGAELPPGEHRQVRRFALGWRIAHLVFALVTMTLVLTGTSALYSASGWARPVAEAFGGAQNLALTHRVAAALFLGIFLGHFVWVMYQLLVRSRGRFRWFGPDSLVPNRKDFADCWGMFKWFVGKGPRPAFERWAYYEKFDYWAVFWGVAVIGGSGLMLAFPHATASVLPGWVLNVATLVHGEEAFLATVFLFTVHFFNNHFRPDKLPPPDIVMFTGSVPLEEFRREHPAHYARLVASGELAAHLVDAPSRPMTLGSRVLGLALIAVGLVLLVLVTIGFFGKL